MSNLSRRHFLKFFGAASLGLLLPGIPHTLNLTSDTLVPPSLMLHSRHWRVLPELLDRLLGEGYTGITYIQWEQSLLFGTPLPLKPVLISVDDITMAEGTATFDYFARMKKMFDRVAYKATFSVITRPDLNQDDQHWSEVAQWTLQGFELATHTSHHSVLDNPKWVDQDYKVEIGDSAAMITARTGQPVRTLVTPFGSGYDIKTQTINPQVVKACRESNIRFVVGIATGKKHMHLDAQAGDVIYMGRIAPGNDYPVNDALYFIKWW